MASSRKFTPWLTLALIVVVALGVSLTVPQAAQAQAGLSTGNIQGTVLDPNGAAVGAAKVTIHSKGTGASNSIEVNSAGQFSSGPLVPGDYVVRIEANGFKSIEIPVTVRVGNISGLNINLEIGSASTVITVEGATVSVDTDQA